MISHFQKKAVVFDLDGTLANIQKRREILKQNPKNWDNFFSDMASDLPNHAIVELFKVLAATQCYIMIVVTGRPERYREVSSRWLAKHDLKIANMFMRREGDRRGDNIVKREILHEIQSSGLEIAFSVDDRESVVKMWRDNGITCLQCDDGNF